MYYSLTLCRPSYNIEDGPSHFPRNFRISWIATVNDVSEEFAAPVFRVFQEMEDRGIKFSETLETIYKLHSILSHETLKLETNCSFTAWSKNSTMSEVNVTCNFACSRSYRPGLLHLMLGLYPSRWCGLHVIPQNFQQALETPHHAILPAQSRKSIVKHNIHVPLFIQTTRVAALFEMTKNAITGWQITRNIQHMLLTKPLNIQVQILCDSYRIHSYN
jgi:hypothetical protein